MKNIKIVDSIVPPEITQNKDICPLVLTSLTDGILLFDEQLKVIYANPKTVEITGMAHDDMLAKSLMELPFNWISNDLKPENILKKIDEAANANSVLKCHLQSIRADNPIEIEIVFSPIAGCDALFLAKLADISMQVAKQKEALAAVEKAEKNDRLKSVYLANMSHEIRTPLNSIIGFSDLLLENEVEREEMHDFFQMINDASKSLLQLIDDIIDISKIEAGQVKINKSLFDINQLLDELLISFENNKHKQNKGHVELRLKKSIDNRPFLFYTDPYRFRQIMLNILSNALKFVDKGYIEFGYTETEPDIIQFYVKDTGIGIDRSNLDVVFRRFGQIDAAKNRNMEGKGLGMAITQQLVELLGGKIWFDTELEKGTTFYFTLPFNLETPSNKDYKRTFSNDYFNWSDRVFLIVDDVEHNFLFIKAVLRQTGALLLWAKNGAEAITICKNNNAISLVLMDIQMPELSGYSTALQIRQFAPHLPIIAQTAFDLENGPSNAIKAGCNGYLLKPINQADLMGMIKKLIDH